MTTTESVSIEELLRCYNRVVMALVKDGVGQNETMKSLPLLIANFLISDDDFNMMNEIQKAAEMSKIFISMSEATTICISLIKSGMIDHNNKIEP
jgi:hypothetical protein